MAGYAPIASLQVDRHLPNLEFDVRRARAALQHVRTPAEATAAPEGAPRADYQPAPEPNSTHTWSPFSYRQFRPYNVKAAIPGVGGFVTGGGKVEMEVEVETRRRRRMRRGRIRLRIAAARETPLEEE